MATNPPRRRLDRPAVLAAAEGIVDREGADGLTMTALAGELGVKVSSLYNHVSSLDSLRGELQNMAMRELAAKLRHEAMGKTGEQGLRALAHSLRAFARTHPGRYELATSEPHDPKSFAEASADAAAALGAIIASYGIEDVSLEFQMSAFAAIHGVVALHNARFITRRMDADHIFEMVLGMVTNLLSVSASSPQALAG